jgi:fatty acyl-CoA reductase
LEKFYKSPIDPQDICKIASLLDRDEIPWLTEKLIDEWPNTYAFTKGIAEGLLRKFDKKLPIAIIRPSIGKL